MTDSTQPSPAADSLNSVLKSAPELGQSPGLAVGVANAGGDTSGNAQGIARGTNAIADANAKQNVTNSVGGDISGALNWFGNSVAHAVSDVVHPIEGVATPVAHVLGKVLNAPMAQVQHEYRYIHDVEARHGPLAAVLEGAGLAIGAAGGLAVSGGNVYAAELGAEAAGALMGQVFHNDSWDRTADGNSYTDPHTHMQVSLGRDLAQHVGLRPGTLVFNVGSGLIDGIADMQVGGSEIAGLVGQARSAEGLGGALGKYFPGISAATAEDFTNSYLHSGAVRNMAHDIAGKDAGGIIATPAYQSLMQIVPRSAELGAQAPDLTGNSFIQALGNADTADKVADVFRSALRTHELVGMDRIPTLSFTRIPTQALREWAEGAGAVNPNDSAGLAIARKFIRLPSAADEKGAISMKTFDPTSPTDNGATALYRTLMYTENRHTAASTVTTYINANVAGKILIYRNAVMNTLLAMSKEMGGPGSRAELNPNDLKEFKKALDHITGGAEPGAEGWMGVGDQGQNLSYAADIGDADRQYAMAITDNQTGKLRMIQLNEMRSMAHQLAGYKGVFGQVAKADSFLYDHITQSFFKPLVLLTPSYAMHIALAELIPNSLRLGVTNMVKAGMAINAAKLGMATKSDEEISALSALAWRLVGGHRAETAARYIDASPEELSKMGQRIQLAARYIELTGGDRIAPGLAAGHNLSAEVDKEHSSETLLRTAVANTPMMRGNEFGLFGRADDGYLRSWHEWLNTDLVRDEKTRMAAATLKSSLAAGKTLEEASNDAAATVSTWLKGQSQSYFDRYDRALPTTKSLVGERPAGTNQLDDWAHVVVQNLRGATRGADGGPVHTELLDKIANGERIERDTLEAIPENLRPVGVKGRKIVPAPPTNIVRDIANRGFKDVLNPMVNFISREPIAFAEFEKQYNRLLPQVSGGVMGEDEAMTIALAKTSAIVIRNVHNLTDRTQWSATLRNWAPFYFAQEQAYRRLGRLLASDPRAFRQYQLMISNVHEVGQVLGDGKGNGYFVIPGTGFLTSSVVGAASRLGLPVMGSAPVGMGWNLNSMTVIFPTSDGIRPGLGPVVAMPIQAIADFFPEAGAPALKADVNALASGVVGSAAMSSPIWEQFIPNTIINRLVQAVVVDQGGTILADRSLASTMMQQMAMLEHNGDLPTGASVDPITLQVAANRIRNQTRILQIMKAIIGAITPVSPEIQVQGENLRTEYRADVAAWQFATVKGSQTLEESGFTMDQLGFPKELNADIKNTGSLAKGIQTYLLKHPDATPQSVFQQVVPNGSAFTVAQSAAPSGAYVQATVAAERWYNDNAKLIHDYPMAAFYLMPQMTDSKYNSTVYNEQLAQGYRVKLSPAQAQGVTGQTPSFLQQLYIAAGNAQFFGPDGVYTKYQAQVKGLTTSQKYPVEQTFYNVTLPAFQKQNPIWGQYWNDNNKQHNRDLAVSQLQEMFQKGDAPAGPLTDQVRGLLKDYETYKGQLDYGNQNNFATEKRSTINQGWSDYLASVATDHPELRAFIQGVFLTLPAPTTGNS